MSNWVQGLYENSYRLLVSYFREKKSLIRVLEERLPVKVLLCHLFLETHGHCQ